MQDFIDWWGREPGIYVFITLWIGGAFILAQYWLVFQPIRAIAWCLRMAWDGVQFLRERPDRQ